MPQTCPKCHRTNPADALYCYEDGFSLGGRAGQAGPVDPGAQPFPHPFVFPNGNACRNFDQLALACHNEWATAVELMRQGDLANFLAGLGRADLARAAREAARQDDKDRALDQLLGQLPANTIEPARLHVESLHVNLGQLTVGKDHRWELQLANQGMRMLSGTVAVDDCTWLALGDGAGSPRKVFQFQTGTTIPVHVRGKLLRAASKPIQGRLVLETNGGTATVVVTAEVPVKPFAEGVLAGATTPRDIASMAKKAPKEAALLFESGAVARWYILNGWTYPVQGPAASGLGAVQQFFEALGLTHPPKVEVGESSLQFEGKPGGGVFYTLDVSAVEKRPVFASAVSDQPWLKVSKVVLDGRTAHVKLAVESVPDRPGETLQAKLTVRANGNQRFDVPVSLRIVGKPHALGVRKGGIDYFPALEVVETTPVLEVVPLAAAQVPAVVKSWKEYDAIPVKASPRPPIVLDAVPLDDEAPPRAIKRGPAAWILPLLPVAFILFCLFVTLVRDLVTRVVASGPEEQGPFTSAPLTPLIGIQFHDEVKHMSIGTGGGLKGGNAKEIEQVDWDPTMRFGLVMLGPAAQAGQQKRLTFDEEGITNNCCISLDGSERLFGESPFLRKKLGFPPTPPGRWTERAGDLGKDPAGRQRQGKRSIWTYDAETVSITQTVELVVGEQSGQLDTCLVRYKLENKAAKPHTVGLRFLLDTFIGDNDGVPFLIPGPEARMVDTTQDLQGASVPQYIEAHEHEDLAHPGTIARLQLRLGDRIEAPNRVTLGAYPNPLLGIQKGDQRCRQEQTMWDVPVYPIKTIPPGDSCVTMYWPVESMPPGSSRDLGFAYGLGDVAAGEGGGKLGLSVGGAFTPGGEFTVTAYVNNPARSQTVTLTLPAGLQASDGGPLTRPVPPLSPTAASAMSPVSWKVKASAAGDYTIKVDSSNGASQSKKVTIKTRSPFGDN